MIDYKESVQRYKAAAAAQYQRPHKASSYVRNNAWHLLDKAGGLLAVVHPTGEVSHGAALLAWQRQFLAGMPAPLKFT